MEMKKTIAVFLSTLLFTATAYAAGEQCDVASQILCTDAGCYWANGACHACEAGTYSLGGEGSTCEDCGTPPKGTEWDPDVVGIGDATECAWRITCPAGYSYARNSGCTAVCNSGRFSNTETTYRGTLISNSNQACLYTCGANSTTNSDGKGCTCKTGYHTSGQDQTHTANDSKTCVGNTYKITYKANGGTGDDITQDVTYGASVTLKGANTFSRDGYTLNGWKRDGSASSYQLGQTITYSIYPPSDITLLAVWLGKSFTITYNLNGASGTAPNNQTCTFGGRCTPAAPSGTSKTGYLFAGWACTITDTGAACNTATVQPTDNIANVSNGANITLTARWTECPAGYYCPNITTKSNCPAGATSAARSTVITQCYLSGGTTKICDGDNNCYTLPASAGQLYYH